MVSQRAQLTVILVSAIVCGAMGMVPLPKHLNYGGGEAMIGSNAVFSSNSHSQLLQAAISRLHDQIFIFNAPPSANQYQLDVSVKSDDENLQFGVGTMQHHFAPLIYIISGYYIVQLYPTV